MTLTTTLNGTDSMAGVHASLHNAENAAINTLTSGLALAAPLASPTLTGTPSAPTATVGTNTTQIATTAFVLANGGSGGGGATSNINIYEATAQSGTTITLPTLPGVGGIKAVMINGQALIATRDWTASGAVITLTTAMTADDVHVEYLDTLSYTGALPVGGDLAGTLPNPTVPGLALKAPIAGPTFTGTLTAAALTVTGAVSLTAGSIASAALVTTLSGKTLTTATLTSPHLTGPVVDSGGLVVAGGLTVDGVQIRQIGSANHSVNGLLNVWQRPVGTYSASGGSAGPDWNFVNLVGTDTISCTQDTAHADVANGAEFALACAFVLGTGAGASGVSSGYAGYKLTTDHFRFFRGRQLTRSWRVRTAVANTVRLSVQTDGTGGTITYSPSFHPGDDTWQTLSLTTPVIPMDATFVQFKVVSSASCTFYVGAHATVLGNVAADPYAVALSPADDLVRCQRYYETVGDPSTQEVLLQGIADTGARTMRSTIFYKVRKAVVPTVTKNGTWNITNATAQPSVEFIGMGSFRWKLTSSGAGEFYSINDAAGCNFSVEANP